jgi:hypothetical protein
MPVNVSASRMAAVLTDFAFTQAVVENYFRRYGCDLTPMYDDQTLWAILGPYDTDTFWQMQDVSDREGTDLVLLTAAGTRMALHEFYEMKRRYMHKHLVDMAQVTPRQIDDIYMSLQRMLDPPSGSRAETIEQYISDPKLRSTGNWGRILRNGFVEAGGTPGDHNPEAVLQVVNRVHDALRARYL